jgi:ribosomal protein S15P/S13E
MLKTSPQTEEKPSWVKIKVTDLEARITGLAKQGNSPALIGTILRDKKGIPKAKLLGKKITKILSDAKVSYIKEKDITSKKINNLKGHIEKNKHDFPAKKSLAKNLWLLRRLSKYQ